MGGSAGLSAPIYVIRLYKLYKSFITNLKKHQLNPYTKIFRPRAIILYILGVWGFFWLKSKDIEKQA